MDFDTYDVAAARTARRAPGEELDPRTHLAVMALGLTGEAGEVADLIKKHIGHGHPLDSVKLVKELGDVLWYLAAICDALNTSLDHVAVTNIEKLKARYPDGFTHAASNNRSV
jgi:NTP pyrophosphatase (non-canonical NTP hydrolase)